MYKRTRYFKVAPAIILVLLTVCTFILSPVYSQESAPAYMNDTWVRLGGPPGGLGYDIRMRPDNPDVMFVTDAHAGVHKSVDGGATWFATNSGISTEIGSDVPIFSLTIDPHNYDIVWAGTQISGHVYRSTDNGANWERRDNGIIRDGRAVRGITIDPIDPNVLYVGVEVDVFAWGAEQGIPDPHGVHGEVYKSTDGGANWTRIWEGENLARYVWIDPHNTNRLYVSTGIFDREAANSSPENGDLGGVGILRSDDGGQTWTVLNEANGLGGLIIPSLYMHPENPDTLIAAVDNWEVGGVYVTYDGGDSWVHSGEAGHAHVVEIAFSNPDIWYAAGEGTIWRSDNAGQNWQSWPLATPHRNAGMPIDLQVDPRDPYRIFDNNYGGGNFMSTDGGQTWVDASVGYTGAAIGGLTVAPGDGRTVFAGANTGAFRSTDAGINWVGMGMGTSGRFVYQSETNMISGDASGTIFHSTDGGINWVGTQVIDLLAEFHAGRVRNDVFFMRALATSPSDPNIVYTAFSDGACVSGLIDACLNPTPSPFRSFDGGYTWESISGAPFSGAGVLRFAVHPENS